MRFGFSETVSISSIIYGAFKKHCQNRILLKIFERRPNIVKTKSPNNVKTKKTSNAYV